MPRANDPATAIELRRGDVERINNAGAQYFKVSGEIEVDGVGEALVDVIFPVRFVGKPRLSYGCELGPGQPYVLTNLPTGDVYVLRWGETIKDDGSVFFTGATLGIVTGGPTGQVSIIQWHVEGIGLRTPSSETGF